MKILGDEIKRRYQERRSSKTSLWSNWVVKIILLIILIIVIRYLGDIKNLFQEETDNQDTEFIEIEPVEP